MYTFFFQLSSHPRILISGILGKNEVRPPHFIYIFHPQIQISARFGKNGLGPNWLNIHLCLGIAYMRFDGSKSKNYITNMLLRKVRPL